MASSPDIEHITEAEPLLVGHGSAEGYDQRKRTAGLFVSGDHGTFLGMQLPNGSSEAAGSGRYESLDHPISIALNICKEKVLKPYNWLLLSVGWVRIFTEADQWWQHVINWFHTMLVFFLILAGYVIQYAGCFRRDSAGGPFQRPDISGDFAGPTSFNGSSSNNNSNSSNTPPCQQYVLSQYVIPDIIHSLAYLYSFYLFRFSQPEQLSMLTERVFLQTSPTHSGMQSQGRLIRSMRKILFIGILWVFIQTVSYGLHMVGEYDRLGFSFLQPSTEFGRIALMILLAVGFIMLDIVYVAVTINYSVQCQLLIVYTESLGQKIREKALDLSQSAKEISAIEECLQSLNYSTALAQSIILFNFGTMAVLGTVIIMTPNNGLNAYSLTSTVLSVLCWFLILAMPVVQAVRLSASLNSLKKKGHELRTRPFVYADTPDSTLDSFLLYTSTLNMRAKLFLVPVKTSYLCGLLGAVVFILLLLFQSGQVAIWLNG